MRPTPMDSPGVSALEVMDGSLQSGLCVVYSHGHEHVGMIDEERGVSIDQFSHRQLSDITT
jgi:hypothetical protein